MRKPASLRVSDYVRHKPGCTTRLEAMGCRRIVLSFHKCTDQLRGYREADLRLCFGINKKKSFLMTRLFLICLRMTSYPNGDNQSTVIDCRILFDVTATDLVDKSS